MMYSKVLVPLDRTRSAEAALEEVIRMKSVVRSVHLLLVNDTAGALVHFENALQCAEKLAEFVTCTGADYLPAVARKLEKAGLPATFSMGLGRPGIAISRAAEEMGAELIVLGGTKRRWPLPSTGTAGYGRRLARLADALVLVVPEGAVEPEISDAAGAFLSEFPEVEALDVFRKLNNRGYGEPVDLTGDAPLYPEFLLAA